MLRLTKSLTNWLENEQILWRETVLDGIQRAPEAFRGLFTGENVGKMLVKLAE